MTLGSPATYQDSIGTHSFSFTNTDQLKFWYATVDYNVTSTNIPIYAAQLTNGTSAQTIIDNILSDPITTNVVNQTIAYYQTALGRVPGIMEAANAVNTFDGASFDPKTGQGTPPNQSITALQVQGDLKSAAPYLWNLPEFQNDLKTAGVSSNVTAQTQASQMSSTDLNNFLTYLYKNDWGASYQSVLTPDVIQYFKSSSLTAAEVIVDIATSANTLSQLGKYILAHENAVITQTEIGAVGFVQGQPLQSLLLYHL